jgi:hypothetical protein
MAFKFVPIEASEQQELVRFLVKSFHAEPDLSSFRPEVIHWKYFSHHPEWKSPRSLAIKQEGQIVAHAGVWPVRFVARCAEVKAIHLIDWAASRSAVGAGVHLLRKVAGLADLLLTIGGSPETRNLLPKLGYRQLGELRQYARVIRPGRQFETTPRKNWKSPIKFLRDSVRAPRGLPSPPPGWLATRITSFPESGTTAIGQAAIGQTTIVEATSFTSSKRTAAGLNHLLNCPAARFSAFQVSDAQRLRGYFVLAQIGGQARVVDIRLDGGDRDSWQAIGALALRSAAENPETCEIVAASSTELTSDAWLQSGLVQRRTEPIFVYDPRNLVSSGPPLDLSLADGDQCFLSDPAFPYLS